MKKILVFPSFLNHQVVPYFTVSQGVMEYFLTKGFHPIISPLDNRLEYFEQVRTISLSLLSEADAVFFQGGEDVSPELYGSSKSLGIKYQYARDKLESEIIQVAVNTGKPIFGICRGMQIINVALGGSLRDIEENWRVHLATKNDIQAYDEFGLANASKELKHDIILEPYSLLQNYSKTQSFKVNSLHHMCVDKLAQSLQVEARSDDGLVEIISSTNKILACQFHPELDIYRAQHKELFDLWISWI